MSIFSVSLARPFWSPEMPVASGGGLSMQTSLDAEVAGGPWAASLRAGSAEACVAACGVGPSTT
eukprot:591359-Lingulodinium_polyedra.AAC.1